MKKFFMKSGFIMVLSLCVLGAAHIEAEAKSSAAEEKWSMEKDTVVSKKGVKYHVYFSKDKKECWVHKVEVKSKKVTKLNFPQKIKNKKLTTIGALPELYPDDNQENQLDACVSIMGEVFEPWHETGADAKTNIQSVKIPNTVKVLGHSSLAGLKKCKRVQLSSNITSIGCYEFYDNRALEQIEIGRKCKEIQRNAFNKCYKLRKITVHKKNNFFSSKKGLLLTKNKKELICVPCGMKKIKIPKGVTTIANEVFCDSKIKEIWIPKSLKKIGEGAFGSTNIKKWHIASGSFMAKTKECIYSKESGDLLYLFHCDSPEKLTNHVTRIIGASFSRAVDEERGGTIGTLYLPKNLKEMDLHGWNKLYCKHIYFTSPEPPKVIVDDDSKLSIDWTIHIPEGNKEKYLDWLQENFDFDREKDNYETYSVPKETDIMKTGNIDTYYITGDKKIRVIDESKKVCQVYQYSEGKYKSVSSDPLIAFSKKARGKNKTMTFLAPSVNKKGTAYFTANDDTIYQYNKKGKIKATYHVKKKLKLQRGIRTISNVIWLKKNLVVVDTWQQGRGNSGIYLVDMKKKQVKKSYSTKFADLLGGQGDYIYVKSGSSQSQNEIVYKLKASSGNVISQLSTSELRKTGEANTESDLTYGNLKDADFGSCVFGGKLYLSYLSGIYCWNEKTYSFDQVLDGKEPYRAGKFYRSRLQMIDSDQFVVMGNSEESDGPTGFYWYQPDNAQKSSKNYREIKKFYASTAESSSENIPAVTPSPAPTQGNEQYYSDMITSGDFSYRIIDKTKKEIAILKIDTEKSKLVIPSELDGYKVVRLGIEKYSVQETQMDISGLEECIVTPKTQKNLKKLIISDGIKGIGYGSFRGCDHLMELRLPEGDCTIGEFAFGCFSSVSPLKKVYIPHKTTMLNNVFGSWQSYNLDEIIIDNNGVWSFDDITFCSADIKTIVFLGQKTKNYDMNSFLLNSVIHKMILNSTVKTLNIYEDNIKIKKLIVNGKNTKIKVKKDIDFDETENLYLKTDILCTVKGAKAISWAKKNKVTYKIKKAPKVASISVKKSGKKYTHNWKGVVTKVETHMYRHKKWEKSVKRMKTTYRIYGKKKGGKYKLIGTTKKSKITSSYKKIRVNSEISWE